MEEDHIKGLASLLVHLSAQGERLPTVKLQTRTNHRRGQQEDGEPDRMPLLNLITENVPLSTGDAMKFAVRYVFAWISKIHNIGENPTHAVMFT